MTREEAKQIISGLTYCELIQLRELLLTLKKEREATAKENAPCPMTEGDIYRGTTSCSPQPHGLRPRRVLAYPAAVTGEPGTAYFLSQTGSACCSGR